jgi:hypothetical protein
MDTNVHLNLALPLAELMTGGVGKKPQPIQTFIRRPRERRGRQPDAQRTRHVGLTGAAVRPIGTQWQETLPGEPSDPRSKATVCTYEVVRHRRSHWPVEEVLEVVQCVKREKVQHAASS